jgi:hypothetical protein
MFSQLHQQALAAAKRLKTAESELIGLLNKIDSSRGFVELGYPSLFSYVHRCLGLSEASTQALILVSRAAKKAPALIAAIAAGEITVSKAKTIAKVLNERNQEQWLAMARSSSTRELEKAVADVRPEAPKPEKLRAQGKEWSRLEISLDEETIRALHRARELLAQKKKKAVSLADLVKFLALEFVRKEDPVEKADRNAARIIHGNDYTAAKHEVYRRDRGSCQFILPNGEKCGARQWVDLHHKIPRAEGGSDSSENLITLCSAHHRFMHRPPLSTSRARSYHPQ